jgi:nucleoid-associated protein YgaU
MRASIAVLVVFGLMGMMMVAGCGPKKEEVLPPEPTEIQPATLPPVTARTPVMVEPLLPPPPAPVARPKTPPSFEPLTPAASPNSYTVQKGDGLMAISRKVYGDAAHWKKIYEANKDRIGPAPKYELKVGTVLTIPLK